MLLSSNITHRGWQTQSIETGQPFSHSLHCILPAFRNSGPETRQCSALHTGPSQPTVFISVKPAAKIFVIASLMPNEPCKYARFVKRSWSTWKVEVFVVVSLPSFLPYFRGVFLFVLVGFFWSYFPSYEVQKLAAIYKIYNLKGMHIHMCLCTQTSQKSRQVSFREWNSIAGFWTQSSKVKKGYLLAYPNDSLRLNYIMQAMFFSERSQQSLYPTITKNYY